MSHILLFFTVMFFIVFMSAVFGLPLRHYIAKDHEMVTRKPALTHV